MILHAQNHSYYHVRHFCHYPDDLEVQATLPTRKEERLAELLKGACSKALAISTEIAYAADTLGREVHTFCIAFYDDNGNGDTRG
jgi:hypothetical protein